MLKQLQSSPSAASPGDIAGLIRHVLCRYRYTEKSPPVLRVPSIGNWPDKTLWQESYVDVVSAGDDFQVSVSQDWQADWLPDSADHPPLRASFLEEERRKTWPRSVKYALDPALTDGLELGFEYYSSPGQRQAIHSVFLMTVSYTHLTLPTICSV